MAQQVPLDRSDIAGQDAGDGTIAVAPDLAYERLMLVNVAFSGTPGTRDWALIDAGLPGTAGRIATAAAERFAVDAPPAAIIVTHGHFDHVGALEELARRWQAPIYAHPLELPYLDGRAAYPPPDPTVGGGALALLSPLFPRGPVDVRPWLHPLPDDGSVPGMPGWRWLHTPGHSVGHVSLWREADRMLIAGDAFVTTAQESVYSVAVQAPELHGPPKYFTHDWQAARESVRNLARLDPELAVTGHGRAMHGAAMRQALHTLAENFDQLAVPAHGHFTNQPQRPATGAYRDP